MAEESEDVKIKRRENLECLNRRVKIKSSEIIIFRTGITHSFFVCFLKCKTAKNKRKTELARIKNLMFYINRGGGVGFPFRFSKKEKVLL